MAIEATPIASSVDISPKLSTIQTRRNVFEYLIDASHGALNPREVSVVADKDAQPKGTFPEFLSANLRNTFEA